MPEFLTVREVTKIFRLKKEETIREWIKKGVFPNAIKIQSSYLIPIDDVRVQATKEGESPSLYIEGGGFVMNGAQVRLPSTLSTGAQTRMGIPLTLDQSDVVHVFDLSVFIQPCIYFLLDADGLVLYVGQTVNLGARLSSHKGAGKEFCRVAIHPTAKENLDEAESQFIEKYRPPLNKKSLDGKWL